MQFLLSSDKNIPEIDFVHINVGKSVCPSVTIIYLKLVIFYCRKFI